MNTPLSAAEQARIGRLHALLGSAVFDQNHPDDGTRERTFCEVIQLLDDVLKQADAAGRRIDFTKEVGVQGKVQDITSLVSSMRRQLLPATGQPTRFETGQFNYYYGAGNGYFGNGVFFVCDYENEAAFFVGAQRVYLNRHLKRAMQEAEAVLTKPAA